MNSKQKILALVTDLYFTTRIESTAERLGYQVVLLEQVSSVGEAVGNFSTYLKKVSPVVVFVDLNHAALPWEKWIIEAKNDVEVKNIHIVCFGSHIDVETMKKAKDTGADEVLAKSRFVQVMGNLIQKYGDGIEDK